MINFLIVALALAILGMLYLLFIHSGRIAEMEERIDAMLKMEAKDDAGNKS